MAHKYILDTHALVWHLEGNPRLGQQAKKAIDDPLSSLILPIIALAEAAYIVEHRRTSIPSVSALLSAVSADLRILVHPLTWEVLEESLAASAVPEMHDRLIVGTALYFQSRGDMVSLLTKDATIGQSQLVTTLW